MFGVSPAYFLSRFGDRFTCRQVAESLADVRTGGFDAVQTEVFQADRLSEWRHGGAALIRDAARTSGLQVSQFVGHFLLHGFETPDALASDLGVEETAAALDGVALFPECRVFTVPLPPFRPTRASDLTAVACASFRARLADKLGRMLDRVEQAGRRMALELIPGNLVGGVGGFLRLHAELGRASLGCNFDTGHAWSGRAWPPLVAAELGDRIFGTHLKDNAQDDAALAPGRGSLPWRTTFAALRNAGYAGSLDIEFRCRPETVDREYREALNTVRHLADAPA
jgi:sugar phosphate isomerase/epimerase